MGICLGSASLLPSWSGEKYRFPILFNPSLFGKTARFSSHFKWQIELVWRNGEEGDQPNLSLPSNSNWYCTAAVYLANRPTVYFIVKIAELGTPARRNYGRKMANSFQLRGALCQKVLWLPTVELLLLILHFKIVPSLADRSGWLNWIRYCKSASSWRWKLPTEHVNKQTKAFPSLIVIAIPIAMANRYDIPIAVTIAFRWWVNLKCLIVIRFNVNSWQWAIGIGTGGEETTDSVSMVDR